MGALAEFGALAVDRDEGLGAVELCLVARALGAHLASVPFLGSAALRYAIEPFGDDLPESFEALAASGDACRSRCSSRVAAGPSAASERS